jgi:DNA-binding CsgD family transcriptional regulator
MATTSNSATRHGPLQRRRIIERPRLLALLDGSTARIRTLVAPAGYGKTTLAEQWIARDGRASAWFRVRRSSADVAALALGVARASTALVPCCDERLREHLRALPAPAENVDVLAEILGEDFEHWPTDAWLVLDEYEEIWGAGDAEKFVEALIASSPIQILVASRRRPVWAKEKAILYGDVLELTQAELAMDDREAAEVLEARTAPSTSGLVALAKGWPAVIGLASVTPVEVDQLDDVPETLYRFFAEEVFGAFDADVREGLLSLAIAPVMDRSLATELLGAELAERVRSAAVDVGVMVERAEQIELHPLARSFLEERNAHLSPPRPESLAVCLDHYRKRHDWDAAFELIARHGLTAELEPLLTVALDELLETARLATIEEWCDLGGADTEAPVFALARAELALRRGRLIEAQAHGEAAATAGSDLAFRALSTAGRAAHLASREEESLELFERAAEAATTESERRDAKWDRLLGLIELELPEAREQLEELSAGVSQSNPVEVVKRAMHLTKYQFKLGELDLAQADRANELVGMIRDPVRRAAFQCTYATALALAARYADCLRVATNVLDDASSYRVDFARPYALRAAAVAYAGCREWRMAHECIDEAIAGSRVEQNGFAEHVCRAASLRILAQQGKYGDAIAWGRIEAGCSVPSARAQYLGAKALVLACAARIAEARSLIEEIRGTSSAIEPKVLTAAVDALIGLKSRSTDAMGLVHAFLQIALRTGASDLLVTAYRAAPELLGVLLKDPLNGDKVAALLLRVGDGDLAAAIGQPISVDDPRSRLTPREHEVLNHVCDGLTSRQIGEVLFITESTVKVHLQHIYDKLGVRSRAALVMQARLERGVQATSAITGGDIAGGPSLL